MSKYRKKRKTKVEDNKPTKQTLLLILKEGEGEEGYELLEDIQESIEYYDNQRIVKEYKGLSVEQLFKFKTKVHGVTLEQEIDVHNALDIDVRKVYFLLVEVINPTHDDEGNPEIISAIIDENDEVEDYPLGMYDGVYDLDKSLGVFLDILKENANDANMSIEPRLSIIAQVK